MNARTMPSSKHTEEVKLNNTGQKNLGSMFTHTLVLELLTVLHGPHQQSFAVG